MSKHGRRAVRAASAPLRLWNSQLLATPAEKQLIARAADKKSGAGSLSGPVVAPSCNAAYDVDDGDDTLKMLL